MTIKTQRKAKAAPEPYKAQPTRKPRKPVPKTTSKSNGKHFLAAYEHLQIGIVEASLAGNYTDVNEEFCRIVGYSKKELLRLGIKDCTHEEDYGIDLKLHQQLVAGEIPFYELEKRYVRKDGGVIWVELTRSLVRDENGKPLCTMGVVIDISDRKQVESVLRESVEHLRLATEAARMFKWEFDFQKQVYTLADNFVQVLGFSAGLMPQNKIESLSRLCPAEDLQAISERVANAIKNHSDLNSLQCRIVNPEDGQRVWLEVNAKVVYDQAGQAQRMFGVAQNISERRQVQEEIRIISKMPGENPNPVMRLTPDGKILYANDASVPLLSAWTQQAEPKIPVELQRAITNAFTARVKTEVEIEHRGNFFLCTLAPILEAGYVNLYGKDITVRKRAENALRDSEERLRASEERLRVAFDTAVVGFATLTPDARFVEVNDAFCQIVGYTREELLAMDCAALTHPFYMESTYQHVSQLVNGEIPSFVLEKLYIRKEGAEIWVQNSVSLVRGIDGEPLHLIAICQDVTERKHVEEQLRKSAEFNAFRLSLTDALRPLSDPQQILAEALRVLGEKLQVDRVLYSEIESNDETILILGNYVKDGVPRLTGHASLSDYGKAREPLSTGRNLVIADATTSPDMDEKDRAAFAALNIRAGLAIPLLKGGRWVATLGVHHSTVRSWTENEIKFMEETAERTWSALERARAQERLRASEGLYRTIARSIPGGGVYVVDKDFRYLVAEGPVTEAFDLTRELLEGRTVSEVFPDERGARMEERLRRVFSGETISFETKNKERVFWTQLAPLQDSIGQAMVLTLDITERKQAEEALERERELLERLFETMPVMVSMYDPETDSLRLNAEFERVIGWKTGEVGRLSLLEAVYPDPGYRSQVTQRMSAAGKNEWVDVQLQTRDGRTLDSAWSNISILNGRQIGIGIDLTERKRIEEALRIENERFMRFVNSNIVGILIGNAGGEVLLANDYYLDLLGVSRQDLLAGNVDWKQFTPAEWLAADEEAIRQLRERGVCDPYEKEYLRTDGTRVPVYIADAMLPGPGEEIAAFVLDITERKRAEDALRQSEERFVRFMQHLPGLAWIKDMQGRYIFANPAAEQAFGTRRERLYGKTDLELFPAEVAAQFQKNDEQAKRYEKGVQTIEILPQGDGVRHYSLVNKFPIPGVDGKVALIGGTAFDITERLQAEEALRESEARFRAIVSQATAGIVRKDAEGRLTFVNEAFCNMLGYPESELLGKMFWEFTYDEDIEENRRLYQRLMREGIPFKLEKRLLRADGAVIWVDLSVSPVMDGDGKTQSAVAVEVDITARKQAEEALQQLNLQLESRVQKRTATIQAINQSLREEIAERKRVEEALRASEASARASEEKLRTLFDLLPVGITFLDPAGKILEMNSAVMNILRLSKAQLFNEAYKSRKYMQADGTPMPLSEFASARALRENRTIYNVETGIVLENGEVIWTSVSAAPVDVAGVGVVVVTVDTTESKRAERALQESHRRLGILSQRLVEVQEEERRALARELHDRVGQTLAALNINLIIINSQLSGDAAQQIGGRLSDSMKLVAETIALVRDVMTDLRPAVLDDYGLEAALESQLSKFISRYDIKAMFAKPDPPLPRLGSSLEMTFLRIAQEALINIARHAHAENVVLTLQQGSQAVCLNIRDDGVGIGSWQDGDRPGSHGLKIMRERAEAFGGQLYVKPAPDRGTIVEVSIPFKSDDRAPSEKEASL